jgi:uncharacterized protein (TIGR02246 family)
MLTALSLVALSLQPAPAAPASCATDPRYRALQFWVGDWVVREPGGRQVARSRIQVRSAGCMVLESYTQADGYSGESINYVDPRTSRWHQHWVDSGGAVSVFEGGPEGNEFVYVGETRTSAGVALRRMTLTPLADGRVRQFSRISRDEGRTWHDHYELLYERPTASATCSADDPEAAQVRAAATGIVDADNARALERVLGYYAADAILLPPGDPIVHGRDRIRPVYVALFANSQPEIVTRVDEVCVSGPMAFVRGHNGGRMRGLGGSPDRALDDDFLMILRKDGDRWQISHLIWH